MSTRPKQAQRWMYAEEVPGLRHLFQSSSVQPVEVRGIEVPFSSAVGVTILWPLASIPAAIAIAFVIALALSILGGAF